MDLETDTVEPVLAVWLADWDVVLMSATYLILF